MSPAAVAGGGLIAGHPAVTMSSAGRPRSI